MTAGRDDGPAPDGDDGVAIFAQLDEHLARARVALARLPRGGGSRDDDDDAVHPLARALDVAAQAAAAIGDAAAERHQSLAAGGAIHLGRDGRGVRVVVEGRPTADEVAAFVDAVRRADARLGVAVAIAATLAGLAARWIAAAFAPPLVLHTLTEAVPRLLALGGLLAGDDTADA